jgi:SNF2 family DNA or RNA helicase
METNGGILADDMGLGKTLSVLATIIRSTEAGRLFEKTEAIEAQSSGMENISRMVFSRATLVIVPSSSMSSFRHNLDSYAFPKSLLELLSHPAIIELWIKEVEK